MGSPVWQIFHLNFTKLALCHWMWDSWQMLYWTKYKLLLKQYSYYVDQSYKKMTERTFF